MEERLKAGLKRNLLKYLLLLIVMQIEHSDSFKMQITPYFQKIENVLP